MLITPEPLHRHHRNTLEGVGGAGSVGGAGNVGRALYTASICQDVTDGAREGARVQRRGARAPREGPHYLRSVRGRETGGRVCTPFQSGG